MSKTIYDVSLLDIMPQSLLDDPCIKALAQALDPELQAIAAQINLVLLWSRIDDQPEAVLDHLAKHLHVDFYEQVLPIATKRTLIKESIAWHKHKGTQWAVEQAVSEIFSEGKVYPWYQYGGNPYYFKVQTDQPITAETDLDRLYRLINVTKNTRSWLENITLLREINGNTYFGGFVSDVKRAGVYPSAFVMPNLNNGNYYGGIINMKITTTINPGGEL